MRSTGLNAANDKWVPALSVTAVAFTGMALIMRVTRNNMLEELGKPYVMTLRAKGLPERMIIWKHMFRNALHPLVTMFGQVLAFLINGFAITSAVLNLFVGGPRRSD